jgi:hypothetical protein
MEGQRAEGDLDRRMFSHRSVRNIGAAIIFAAAVATIGFNFFTITQILYARTRVPWLDEWAMLQEFILYKRGASLSSILWSSYWGHRLVIPRLIIFANLQWASWVSLTWLTLTIQSIHIGLLCALSWMLVRSRGVFAVSAIVILNLMLSPLQTENFAWGMQFMFPLVYTAASLSFLCLALKRDKGSDWFLALSVVAAAVASYTMPNGLLVWPVLAVQSIYLRLNRRVTLAIALLGASIIASYCWHYAIPSMGMGLTGMLHHPVDAVMLTALLLGGALNSVSIPVGIIVTVLALAGAFYVGRNTVKGRPPETPWLSALAAIVVFLFLSAVSIVAGRLTPQWLGGGSYLIPGRYNTLIDSFWAALAILVLYTWRHKSSSRMLTAFYCVLYLCLMFLHPRLQKHTAEDWSDFFRGTDAVGAAFILDAPDEALLSILWPQKPQRDSMVAFLRQRHWAVFAQPRAAWPGRPTAEVFPGAAAVQKTGATCIGGIEKALSLGGVAEGGSWRIEGWAWDTSANRGFDDILIADPKGLVVGMARGGFRHRYFPGFFTDIPVVPVPHMRFPASEWLGYVRQPVKTPWTVYGIAPHADRICIIEEGN